MANHQQWQDLTIIEKIKLVGQLTHLLQNDLDSFKAIKNWVLASELLGLFNEVKINDEGNS
jgi:hypothetical protein